MSFLGIGKTCVFSSVTAVLTKNGEPLEGVRVIRRWEWNELKQDETTTNEQGVFEFSAVYESSVSRLLPVELVIAQGLYVEIEGREEKIWSNTKRRPEDRAEFGGMEVTLICELTNKRKIYRDFGSVMNTLCTWEEK